MKQTQPIPYPQPIPMGRMHRCTHPVRHSLNVLSLIVGWLYWSIHTNGQWGPWLAAVLDPKHTGIGLPIAVLTNLAWLVLIPLGTIVLYLVGMWHCTGPLPMHLRPDYVPPSPDVPSVPGRPVLIERVLLTPEDAARRGLPGPVIVERIHYR
jgi:hypothetical protein